MSTPLALDASLHNGQVVRFNFAFNCYTAIFCPTESGMEAQWTSDLDGSLIPSSVHLDLLAITGKTGYLEGRIVGDQQTPSDIIDLMTQSFNANTHLSGSFSVTSVEDTTVDIATKAASWFKGLFTLDYKTTAGFVGIAILILAVFLLVREVKG